MSLSRLVFYSAIVGGWSAFAGWLLAELLMGRWVGQYLFVAVMMAGIIAGFIGAGLSQVAGLVNLRWAEHLRRLIPGLIGGLAGGLAGVLLGSGIHSALGEFGRVIGWMLMGIGIGVAEGIYERSFKKIRNGVIGGALGGFLGGLLFLPVSRIIGTDLSSRATSFVILGVFIGLFIGLVQVVLKEAWLTVEEGFRAGRQLILSQPVSTLGTSERASLIFIAYGAKGVEPVHLQIQRQSDGKYVVQDNQSRTGTFINGQRLTGAALLRNNDRIQFGPNVVRFNDGGSSAPAPMATAPAPAAVKPAPAMGIPIAPAVKPPPVKPVAVAAAPQPKPVAPAAQGPVPGSCPICQRKSTGIPGRRKCENCGAVF